MGVFLPIERMGVKERSTAAVEGEGGGDWMKDTSGILNFKGITVLELREKE
jgi:hypothetical protein